MNAKLDDLIVRLEWFKRQSVEFEVISRNVGDLLVEVSSLVLADNGQGLSEFIDKYKTFHEDLFTKMYLRGKSATSLTGQLLHESGKSYARTEAHNHDLVAQVEALLKNY